MLTILPRPECLNFLSCTCPSSLSKENASQEVPGGWRITELSRLCILWQGVILCMGLGVQVWPWLLFIWAWLWCHLLWWTGQQSCQLPEQSCRSQTELGNGPQCFKSPLMLNAEGVTWNVAQRSPKCGVHSAAETCITVHCSVQSCCNTVNSLWPSDAIWQHRSGSTVVQVMACCLMAPSHYLNQCWLIINEVQWQSPEGNVIRGISVMND